MHLLVVHWAQKTTIFYCGFTIVDPVLHMARSTNSWGSIAGRESASAVPSNKCAANTQGDSTHGATDIERLRTPPNTTGITLHSHAIRRASSALISYP
jgi:hypothetical protein